MPEGDSLARAARRLQALVGERVEVETPHPRAAVKRLVERLDGRRLLGVEAAGKNLLLRFEDGVVLRSHLRMSGRWQLRPRGSKLFGRPWLVLRGAERGARTGRRQPHRLLVSCMPTVSVVGWERFHQPGLAAAAHRPARPLFEAQRTLTSSGATSSAVAAYASSRAGGCCTRTPPCAARPSWPHVRCFRASEPPVPSPLRWPESDADHRSPLPPSRPSRNFSAT